MARFENTTNGNEFWVYGSINSPDRLRQKSADSDSQGSYVLTELRERYVW